MSEHRLERADQRDRVGQVVDVAASLPGHCDPPLGWPQRRLPYLHSTRVANCAQRQRQAREEHFSKESPIRRIVAIAAATVSAIAAVALGLPAAATADTSSASATVECGQPINITFSGFLIGPGSYIANYNLLENGQTATSGQYTLTTSGATFYPNVTASAGNTWEVTANWSSPRYSGSYDSGPVSCPAPPPPQTSVTTNPPTAAPPPPPPSTPPQDTPPPAQATPPTADFTAQATGGVGQVAFVSTTTPGTNPISQTVWAFGDGGGAIGTSPTHTYNQAGEYIVTLTVVDTAGLTALAAYDLTVSETPGVIILGRRIALPNTATAAEKQAVASTASVTVTGTVQDSGRGTLAAALSKSVDQPVLLPAGTIYQLHGVRITAAKFVLALKTRHKVKILGTRQHGKLVASRLVIA